MSIVHCELPRSGIGNQLFPLLKANIFAHLNELPVCITGYHQFKIGPYLRKEKSKRTYSNYFVFQKNIMAAWWQKFKLDFLINGPVINEPDLKIMGKAKDGNTIFKFETIPHWNDYFEGIREHRVLAIQLLYTLLENDIKQNLAGQPSPCIGVHIRMGDFRKLKQGEDFSKVGAVRTPENYFIECIRHIRDIYGSSLPVSVFTDGYRYEIKNLLELENIKMITGNPDIVDLLLLSRSQIIVTSAGSTFSYWAGFLADAPLIMHYDHLHQPLRPPEINQRYYEGPLIAGQPDSLLVKNIMEINNFDL